MSLPDFLAAVHAAAKTYAPEYGLTPEELEVTMLTAAGLEGGLGPEASVGDNGHSFGRFQFNTAGGHGATLLNQGHTLAEISDDKFQAMHWTPIVGAELAKLKMAGMSGPQAIRQAIFNAERPAQMYDAGRFNNAMRVAESHAGLAQGPGLTLQAGSSGGSSGGGTGMPTGTPGANNPSAVQYWTNRREASQLKAQYGLWFPDPNTGQVLGLVMGLKSPPAAEIQQAWQRLTQLEGEIKDFEDAYAAGGGATVDDITRAYDFFNSNDPAAIDAKNAAARYAREYQARTEASQEAIQQQQQQTQDMRAAQESQGIDRNKTPTPGAFMATPARLLSGDELFQRTLDRIKGGLPNVPDMPYPQLPAGGPEGLAHQGPGTAFGTPPPQIPGHDLPIPANARTTPSSSSTPYGPGLPGDQSGMGQPGIGQDAYGNAVDVTTGPDGLPRYKPRNTTFTGSIFDRARQAVGRVF